MAILLDNKILQATEKKVESQLLPDVRDAYMRIVVAGMATALHGGSDSILAKLKDSQDPISDCAKGAINLVLLMQHQSRGTMPVKAIPPAAMTLMLQALDFADKMKIARIGNAELVKATHIFTNYLFEKFKITPKMLHAAASNVHGVLNDPTSMEKINRKVGTVRTPGASEPTNLQTAPGAKQ